MFNRQQQVFLQAGITVLIVYFLVRIGGLDSGPAILWGLLVGFVFIFWRRQDMLVETHKDLFEGTMLAEMFSAEAQPWTPPMHPASPPQAERPTPDQQSKPVANDDLPKSSTLDRRQENSPDDLKRITGVGPKLEQQLNAQGIYHYEQIANWTEADVTKLDETIPGLKGRVGRDEWVDHAKSLVSGNGTSEGSP